MRSTTPQSTIDQVRQWFAAYGLPEEVVSDNGPQLISQEFTDFLKQNGVKQTLVPPYHPSSNGAAERAVQILKRALRKHAESVRRCGKKRSLKHQQANCLFQYRNTPHSVTGVTPSELFLKRKPCTKFSILLPNTEEHILNQQARQQRQHVKSRVKLSVKANLLRLRNLLLNQFLSPQLQMLQQLKSQFLCLQSRFLLQFQSLNHHLRCSTKVRLVQGTHP